MSLLLLLLLLVVVRAAEPGWEKFMTTVFGYTILDEAGRPVCVWWW